MMLYILCSAPAFILADMTPLLLSMSKIEPSSSQKIDLCNSIKAEALKWALHCAAGGEFSLFYTNCEKLTVVSFDIKVALYNVRASGYKDFLSVGEDMLPLVFMVRQSSPGRHVSPACRTASYGKMLGAPHAGTCPTQVGIHLGSEFPAMREQ